MGAGVIEAVLALEVASAAGLLPALGGLAPAAVVRDDATAGDADAAAASDEALSDGAGSLVTGGSPEDVAGEGNLIGGIGSEELAGSDRDGLSVLLRLINVDAGGLLGLDDGVARDVVLTGGHSRATLDSSFAESPVLCEVTLEERGKATTELEGEPTIDDRFVCCSKRPMRFATEARGRSSGRGLLRC